MLVTVMTIMECNSLSFADAQHVDDSCMNLSVLDYSST